MRELARLLQGLTAPFTLDFSTDAEAVKMRHNCYGFAGALEANGEQGLADAMRSIEIRKKGTSLTFISRIDTEAYLFIDKLINKIREQGEKINTRVAVAEKNVAEHDSTQEVMDKLGYSQRSPANPAPTPSKPQVAAVPDSSPQPTTDAASAYDEFMKRTSNDNEG
jgi:hypothetical protein